MWGYRVWGSRVEDVIFRNIDLEARRLGWQRCTNLHIEGLHTPYSVSIMQRQADMQTFKTSSHAQTHTQILFIE